MRMSEVGAALLRRWYLTLVGLLATAGVAFGVMQLVPPTYETEANVVLLPPPSSVGEGGNPYLYLGGLDQAADIVTRSLTSDQSRTRILDALGHADFDVLPDWATSGPVLIVTARGATPDEADELRLAVLNTLPTTLLSLQDTLDVPTEARISSMVLTADDEPTTVRKSQLRAVMAATAVAAVAVVMLIGLIDGLMAPKRRTIRHPVATVVTQAIPPIADGPAPQPTFADQRATGDQAVLGSEGVPGDQGVLGGHPTPEGWPDRHQTDDTASAPANAQHTRSGQVVEPRSPRFARALRLGVGSTVTDTDALVETPAPDDESASQPAELT